MKQIRTALVGFGSGGRIYNGPIIASLSGYVVDMILTSNPENIEAAERDFSTAKVVQDYDEILNNEKIDLVVVLLPNHLHCQYARKALIAGKHVVVEKPITPSVKEARELIQLARQCNRILSVNHNRRWDSDFLTIRNLVREKKLGEIREYEAHFDRFRPEIKNSWKENAEYAGGGILYDLGSHLIDQALVLFGTPKEVFADIRQQRAGAKVPDNFELLLLYPNLRVRLMAGMLVKEKGPTFSLHGTHGSFLKYGNDVQEEALKQGQKPMDDPQWGIEPDTGKGILNTITEEADLPSEQGDYRGLYENVYQAIMDGRPLAVTPEQAMDVVKVIELAYQSNSSRRIVKFDSE